MGGAGSAPIVSEELKDFLESGLSLSIATRNAELAPDGTRVWAATVDGDRRHVTAFLTAKTAGPILANLEDNQRIALCFDRPSDSRACQLKGVFVGSRRCRPAERAEIERQFRGFLDDLAIIGVPAAVLSGWVRWPAVAVRFEVTDVFTQTPGPGAGERMP
jgi:predicted pyridoxine 5'-phosphate oxidase superfamily flavin-nucleotide-binding protein